MGSKYLAESIEDLVEVDQNFPLCNLGDVIHALTCIVADTSILIGEAGKHRGHDFVEVAGYFLCICQGLLSNAYAAGGTYWAESNRGGSKADKTAVPRMGLMNCIRILVAELEHNLLDLCVVVGSERVPYEAFKLEGAALPLVVELVVERFGDIGIHSG